MEYSDKAERKQRKTIQIHIYDRSGGHFRPEARSAEYAAVHINQNISGRSGKGCSR